MNAIMKLSILQSSAERRQVHGMTKIYFPILDLLKTLFLDSGASLEKGDMGLMSPHGDMGKCLPARQKTKM